VSIISKEIKWPLSVIRSKVEDAIREAIGYQSGYLNISIEDIYLQNDTLVIEGSYSKYIFRGEMRRFHIELNHDTLRYIKIKV